MPTEFESTVSASENAASEAGRATVLEAHKLVKRYRVGKSTLTALDGVSFDLLAGETHGIVGESGCGKSTLAKLLVGLETPDEGAIELQGKPRGKGRRQFRQSSREIQMVFQDPYTALNPKMTAGDIVREPFEIHPQVVTRSQREARIVELFERVGLPAEARHKYPAEFSGGQRQRIGIARALALDPSVIVCDESVAALDVSIQAQVLNLLNDLKDELGISYVFISHDLSIMRQISDRVSVLYLGRVVETGSVEDVFERPQHPYTRALLEAVPVPDPEVRTAAAPALQGDVPSPLDIPSGCAFRTRCPIATERCATERPELTARPDSQSRGEVACHYPLTKPV